MKVFTINTIQLYLRSSPSQAGSGSLYWLYKVKHQSLMWVFKLGDQFLQVWKDLSSNAFRGLQKRRKESAHHHATLCERWHFSQQWFQGCLCAANSKQVAGTACVGAHTTHKTQKPSLWKQSSGLSCCESRGLTIKGPHLSLQYWVSSPLWQFGGSSCRYPVEGNPSKSLCESVSDWCRRTSMGNAISVLDGGPVVRNCCCHCVVLGSIPDQGIKILQAT